MIIEGQDIPWLGREDIRPYIFVREHNRSFHPGAKEHSDWFSQEPLMFSPMRMGEVHFADEILALENLAFAKSDMAMPRWVFYDCAVMPGFVAGYAQKTSTLPENIKQILKPAEDLEWTPISLFIIIPTMAPGEWVAHNLCSVNSMLPRKDRYYGLGFLTKAFGLWQANIDICCGITQWRSPAIKLHSHYGHFEVLTAFTPVHDYSHTLTYRLKVNQAKWGEFFSKKPHVEKDGVFEYAGFEVHPTQEKSLIDFQVRIEDREGPFYLDSAQIRNQDLDLPLKVYKMVKDNA